MGDKMKRDLSVITPDVRELIIGWFNLSNYHQETMCPGFSCSVCKSIFPSLKPKNGEHPCKKFGLKYVKRVAREILRKTE